MSEKFLNQSGLSHLWDRIKASQDATLHHLFEADRYGPSSLVSFESEVGGLPLYSLSVNIAPQQEGSGNPSPENVRTITGWSGLNLYISPTTDEEDGTLLAVDWSSESGTVYGGTLDVLTGVLTVDRATNTKTWGSLTNSANIGTTIVRKRFVVSNLADVSRRSTIISNVAKMGSAYDSETVHIFVSTNVSATTYIYVFLPVGTEANQEIQLCYPLAEPVTYQLTPQQVKMLSGTNCIWADTGDVTVECGALLQVLQREIEQLANANET